MGAVDFLFKPIVPEVLRSKVAVFVELSRNTETLRRQADILAKAEQKFRSLLEAAPDAIIISSEDGRIHLVNSQVEAVFGYPRKELIQQSIHQLVPDWNGLSTPAGSFKEVGALRKNASTFPAEISLSPLQTDEGILVISAVRDITKRKAADDAVRELNLTLERRVAERTQELLDSNKALRHSNEDLNQFAYAASHDLQEPLRMVSLYCELLQSKYGERLDEQADRFISFAVNGARHMEMLLKDLLAYSQAGAAAAGPAGPVNCETVVDAALFNLQTAILENGASIRRSGLPTIRAHEIRLVQLFQNLIGNAIKYRREEAPVVTIEARRDGSEWLFSVQDNGIGIKPEYNQQIFGIFRLLHGNTYAGTGIGLAICQRIVENYGGRIWVESTPGEGSRFSFTLPALS